MKKINLFVDMDGVLAEQQNDLIDFMFDKDFFLNRPPVHTMLEVVKKLEEKYNVYILTSVVGNEHCEPEKGLWLDKYLPEIKKENRLYVPAGKIKADFVNEKLDVKNSASILFDDFTENLKTWSFPGAIPVKVLNGLNNNFGTWVDNGGLYIDAYESPVNNVNRINLMVKKILLAN